MARWPIDNQAARNAFYGDPARGQIGPQMVPVVPPFAMYYDGKRVKAIQFHRKAAAALLAALHEIWDHCEHDQAKIDAAGVSKYAGAYNPRKVRGSATKWSNHAYAAAIDLNAAENAMYAEGNMPQFVIDAFCRQGWMWGGWYMGRKDPMHFEAVDNGGRFPKSPPPIWPRNVGLGLLSEADVPDNVPADEFEDGDDSSLNVQPVSTPQSIDVEMIQRKLDELGYHEVGTIDGLWGGRTSAAIAAFKNDRGLSGEPVIDKDLKDAIDHAVADQWTRPISTTRATATAADIAPQNVTVQQTLWQRMGAKITGFGAAGTAAATGVSNQFGSINEQLLPLKRFFAHVPTEIWFLLIAGAAFLVWYSANKATQATVKDYNTGKLN